MSKSDRNTGKPWSAAEKAKLAELAKGNTPTRVIGLKLGRTEDSVRSQAARQDVSLKPTNQASYNRALTVADLAVHHGARCQQPLSNAARR